jgi:hypothetical protein
MNAMAKKRASNSQLRKDQDVKGGKMQDQKGRNTRRTPAASPDKGCRGETPSQSAGLTAGNRSTKDEGPQRARFHQRLPGKENETASEITTTKWQTGLRDQELIRLMRQHSGFDRTLDPTVLLGH